MCEQCGSQAATTETEYGPLCAPCAMRQAAHDERRAAFAHLTALTFGFDRYEQDPYDD